MALEFQLSGSSHTLVALDSQANNHFVKIPTRSSPTTGSVVGICGRTTGLMSIAVATFSRCGSQRRKGRRSPRTDTPGYAKNRTFSNKEEVPMSRLGHVLSRFRQRRRKMDGKEVKGVSCDHHPKGEPVVDLSSYGIPFMYDIHELGTDWPQDSMPHELPCPGMERHLHEPIPAHNPSMGMAEWGTNLASHYMADNATYPAPVPAFGDTNNGMPPMPVPTMPGYSDRQPRRFDVPSPLRIVPPPTSSISISRRQFDTTSTAPYIPYSPYDYYEPYVDSPIPSLSPSDEKAPSFTYDTPSTRSSSSARSSPQPRSPAPFQSPGPAATSMSRTTSSDQTEPLSKLPPTPTYLQSQRAPIDSDNIICLGPLPDNISPKNLQFQPQRPRLAPFRTTRQHDKEHNNNKPPTARRPPYQALAVPTPAREQQQPAPAHQLRAVAVTPGEDSRRRSADSLGSNFTVEEEARIQAQKVRNLAMLGQERVGGKVDIVHIPQPSARRFSFEDDR